MTVDASPFGSRIMLKERKIFVVDDHTFAMFAVPQSQAPVLIGMDVPEKVAPENEVARSTGLVLMK
jgi:hypothetical protein